MKRGLLWGLLSGILLLTLAGCGTTTRHPRVSEADIQREAATQRRMALETELERRQRLFDVVYRLARAAAPECGGGRPLPGFELGGIGLVQRPYQDAGEAVGLDQAVSVTAVAESSPAHAAGMRRGDVLQAINGQAVDGGKHAYRDAGFALAEQLAAGPVTLALLRDGLARNLVLHAERGCPSDLFITREALPTPKANGKAVLMPVSFMRQARTPDELAAITAFLMAYNVRGQADTGQGMALTSIRNLSVLIGEDETNLYQPPQPVDYNGVREADAYALTLARRAGFDPARVVYFWRRYLVNTPALEQDVNWGRHLTGVTRMARLRQGLEQEESK